MNEIAHVNEVIEVELGVTIPYYNDRRVNFRRKAFKDKHRVCTQADWEFVLAILAAEGYTGWNLFKEDGQGIFKLFPLTSRNNIV